MLCALCANRLSAASSRFIHGFFISMNLVLIPEFESSVVELVVDELVFEVVYCVNQVCRHRFDGRKYQIIASRYLISRLQV